MRLVGIADQEAGDVTLQGAVNHVPQTGGLIPFILVGIVERGREPLLDDRRRSRTVDDWVPLVVNRRSGVSLRMDGLLGTGVIFVHIAQ